MEPNSLEELVQQAEDQPATPPPQSDPTPQPEPEGEPPEIQPELDPILARASEHGMDVSKFKDPDEFFRSYTELNRRIGQRDEDAKFGRDMRTYLAQQQLLAAQAQPQPQQPVEEKLWDAPEFDSRWLLQVTEDEHGNIIPRPGQPPEVAQKVASYYAWARNKQQAILTNPQEEFAPLIRAEAKKVAREALEEYQTQQRHYAAQQQSLGIVERHSGWMFHNGQVAAGNMTPAGELYTKLVMQGQQMGITDSAALDNYATNLMEAYAVRAQAQAPNNKARPNIRAAIHQTNTTQPPTTGAAAELVRDNESLDQALMRQMGLTA